MLTQDQRDEILAILDTFFDNQRPNGSFYSLIRTLSDAQINYRRNEDVEWAVVVIQKVAEIHVRLVRETPLRETEELNYAIELADSWVVSYDYARSTAGAANLSDSS